MQSLAQMFQVALQLHQAGNLPQAEAIYRQILQIDPKHVESLHLFGVIAHQVGKHDVAISYIQEALRLYPRFCRALNNLGLALRALGKPRGSRWPVSARRSPCSPTTTTPSTTSARRSLHSARSKRPLPVFGNCCG